MDNLLKYLELTKPKVTLLNLLVGVTCFFLAAYPSINWIDMTIFSIAGYLACGGCGALNCVYDKNSDLLMQRTAKRAIPSGAIKSHRGLIFGLFLVGGGVAMSYYFFNALTALMMTLGAIFYLLVYTVLLKRTSNWNVIIGGVAGCFAALSGWTAVANSLSALPFMVSTVDFLWTPGHLWGLAIKKVTEYKHAKIPMLPVTAGLGRTAKVVFFFNAATVASSLALPFLGLVGGVYALFALSGGMWYLFESRRLMLVPSEVNGFRVFFASMPYLAVLLIGIIVDKLVLGLF